MTTRSTVLGLHHSTGSKDVATLYTCPTGSVAIVKSVYVFNGSTVPDVGEVFTYDTVKVTRGELIHGAFPVATVVRWDGWLVMTAGQILYALCGVPGVDFWASGAQLPVVVSA